MLGTAWRSPAPLKRNIERRGYCLFAIKYFSNYYWESMSERFDLKERPTDLDNPDEIVAVAEAIGRKRGASSAEEESI